MTEFDVEFARAQFPQYRDPIDKRVAMFENAGSAYAPDQVVNKLVHFFNHTKVQPYYLYGPSVEAGAAMDRSRQLLAASINAEVDEIHFGPSTTLNLYVLAHALRTQMTDGDEIVVSHQDHEANIGAWARLGDTGINVKVWKPDSESGLLDTRDLAHLLTNRTQLVCVTHCSNVVAVVNPITEITALCHAAGARVVVDGVSFAPHDVIDVRALNVDFYVYSLYKSFGPHLGVLYVRRDHVDQLPNQGHFFHDGQPSKYLTPAGPDHGEIACAGGIIDYYQTLYEHHWPETTFADATINSRLQELFEVIQAYEHTLVAPLLAYLDGNPRIRVLGYSTGSALPRAPIVAFTVLGLDNPTIAAAMAAQNIGCGYGYFYAYHLMECLNIDPHDGATRLSMAHYNTPAEISRAIEVLDNLL